MTQAWVVTTNTSLQQQQQPSRRATTTKAFMATSTGDHSRSSNSNSDLQMTADPLAAVRMALDNSWIAQLSAETPENFKKSLARVGGAAAAAAAAHNDEYTSVNQSKRPVLNGHYVKVRPTGLLEPRLMLTSVPVATEWLKMTMEQLDTDDFTQWVSGNLHLGDSWATPYALSIMGTRYTHNCPFGDGTGYGDGRAIR